MLYTQQLTIPESGVIRIGTIGGEPYEYPKNDEGIREQKQVGYMLKPRVGLLLIMPLSGADTRIFDCTAKVSGYSGRLLDSVKVPGRIFVEFPCSVELTGDEGLELIIEAWHVDSVGSDRGALQTALAPANGISIPIWASSFDLPAASIATFRDSAGGNVGAIRGSVTNFSIPAKAATVDVVSEPNTPITFRQQG